MKNVTCADAFRPIVREKAFVYDVALVGLGSLVLALSARISLPMWPVPITAQTFAVVMLGAFLGSRRATVAVLAYLAEGAMGLPVFANGGFGAWYMMGPSGGYLLGFVGAAWLTGYLVERGWDKRMGTLFLAMTAGHLVIYAFGFSWLASFVGIEKAWLAGMMPFLPGDLVKVLLATALIPAIRKAAGTRIGGS